MFIDRLRKQSMVNNDRVKSDVAASLATGSLVETEPILNNGMC